MEISSFIWSNHWGL